MINRSQGGMQQVAIPSNQVFVQDSTAIISGIALQDNSHYFVLLSDSAFLDTVNQLATLSIADSTFGNLDTEDTIAAPNIPPLKSLSEAFWHATNLKT